MQSHDAEFREGESLAAKPFRSQASKDAAIASLERQAQVSAAMMAKYDQLYQQEMAELRKLKKQLERIKSTPIQEG